MTAAPVFLHIDIDAFFAAAEQLDHPTWKGKPVIVGGKPGDRRSVVSTASYEARGYGVHSAMAVAEAVRRCPHGIYVRPRMQRYHELSEQVMAVFHNYSPDVQQMSVDEAFVDLTGTERLFGPPAETARRIQAEVREKTGLTVSVGMASTRYVAKIASSIRKPNGLCIVPAGSETDFMLSLPLTKLWGAGAKTQERLRAFGILTCRDVYSRSLEALQSIFGRAGGSFLYNAVRGGEAETFAGEAKSHSVSSESTYPYDLTTRDAIDTALLELSYTVVFRLLRGHLRSSDVALKIRYDDFTTVHIQESSTRDISSVDDLFERAKTLFYRKYESPRGIRLLGLSAQDVEDNAMPRQAELFDFGDERRRRLERAIFAAQQKNPAIKITKARLLEHDGGRRTTKAEQGNDDGTTERHPSSLRALLLAPALLALSAVIAPTTLRAETGDETERTADGAGSIVFDTSALPLFRDDSTATYFDGTIAGKRVEFLAQGYWQTAVAGSARYRFGFGSSPEFSTEAPVFTQKVDLSLWFLLDTHWYFEADFADGFERNTVAAGYRGDRLVTDVRLANRGIAFPSLYSVDDVGRGIGGGSARSTESQAPGLSLQLSGKNWRADAAVRYDLLSAQEKNWYGMNSVTETTVALSDWHTGSRYVLPDARDVLAVRAVYVENAGGGYRDANGRRYKQLDKSQYLLVAAESSVYLARDAAASRTSSGVLPAVAIAFTGSLPDTAAFIADTAEAFSAGGITLAPYLYALTGTIDGEAVLYVQHPAGFSPFATACRYDAGFSGADAVILSQSTGSTSTVYRAAVTDDDFAFASTDFFYDSHTYVDVYTEETAELPPTDARARFPFAAIDAGIYLGYGQMSDLALSVRSYTAVSRLDIGTSAMPGTIRVYKNGILDSSARYDAESGTLTLSNAIAASDRIHATWYEDSKDADTGALAAATGVLWQPTPRVSLDMSAATRWTYAGGRTFATSDYSVPAFATLASKVSYQDEHLVLSNTVAASIESENTTGLYRVLGMDDAESDWMHLAKDAATDLPDGFVPTVRTTSGAGTALLLLPENNGSTRADAGTSDSALPGGYAVPVHWDFSAARAITAATPAWAATALSLPGTARTLAASSRFTLYLRAESLAAVDVYLQLGVEANDDFAAEDSDRVPTWHISDATSAGVASAFVPTRSGWQLVTVELSNHDRSRLSYAHDARLIVTSADGTPVTGTLYAGSYRTDGARFTITTGNAVTVVQREESDSSLASSRVKKLNTGTNYVQRFDWRTDANVAGSAEDTTFTAARYFDEVDLGSYGELSLYFKLEAESSVLLTNSTFTDDTTLTVALSRPRERYRADEDYDYALRLTLPTETLRGLLDSDRADWHELTVNLHNGNVSVDGTRLTTAATVNTDVLPTHFSVTLVTASDDGRRCYTRGTLSLDELSLSDAVTSAVLQNIVRASWRQDGAVLATSGGKAVVGDLFFATEGVASATLTSGQGDAAGAFATSAEAGATVLGFRLSAEVASADTTTLTNGGHRLQTAAPLWQALTASESYSFSMDNAAEKSNAIGLDLTAHGVPLRLSAETDAALDWRAGRQNTKAHIGFQKGMFSLDAEGSAIQHLTGYADAPANYAQGWLDTTSLAFDAGSAEAVRRTVSLDVTGAIQLPLLRFKPTISFTNGGRYRTGNEARFTDDETLTFSLPFAVTQKHRFAISWTKKAGSTNHADKGGNYRRDLSDMLAASGGKDWYWRALPIYDLISANLPHTILEETALTAGRAESLYYEGSYSASWKRVVFGTSLDIMLPSNLSVTFSRSIRTASSLSDLYQLKATVGYTALNVFGTQGTFPIASWFRQDEYSASGSATLKIPRGGNGNLSMLYTTYAQAVYFVSKEDLFKAGFEASFERGSEWSGGVTVVWKRRGTVSPLAGLIDLFAQREAAKKARLTRTDSINVTVSSMSNTNNARARLRYSGDIKHELDVAISGSLTLNASGGIGYEATQGERITLIVSSGIGISIRR